MADEIPQFTPVTLLTGFLGSGKTTLLQRLLADPALGDTAVLINEFGEVGLDHHLLERIDERTVLLQSGCLCCTIRGELSDAIRDLQSRRARGEIPPFRRLAIETTGLADPFPVLTTLHADPVLKHHFRIGSVITTVDAVNGAAQLARFPENLKQIAVADRLVLTKTDIADPDTTWALLTQLRRINPAASIVYAATPQLDAAALLSDSAFATDGRGDLVSSWLDAPHDHAHHGHEANRHGDDVHAFAIVLDRRIDWTVFGIWLTMLLNRHGDAVLRVKGILDIGGDAPPVAVHGVQHLVHPPVHMKAWPDNERRSRIVFIVKGLERAAIERSLFAFLTMAESSVAAIA